MQQVKGKLVLADGTSFAGELWGEASSTGEVVFTTSMGAYQEALTDPAYGGQIVVMTYPLIGNYGCSPLFSETERSYCRGLVVSELCLEPSNWRSVESFPAYLERQQVPVLTGVDTRALTRHIRKCGVMQGILVPGSVPTEEALTLIASHTESSLVRTVTTQEVYQLGEGSYRVAVVDYGTRRSALTDLAAAGCSLTIYPSSVTATELLRSRPDGIYLSSGPGNPLLLTAEVECVRSLIGRRPLCGVGLGHQILALAHGGAVTNLPFGHRGANHPVQVLSSGKVLITSQNHGYVVTKDDLEQMGAELSHASLNDGTVEGLRYRYSNSVSVQYYPEANDSVYSQFIKLMGGR